MSRLMCLKCGNTQAPYDGNKGYCIICNNKMTQIPNGYGFSDEEIETFLSSSNNSNFEEYWKQNQQRLFDEIISRSPEFDINLYNNRDSISKQQERQQEEVIAHGKAILEEKSNIPKCPTCSSTNVEKISISKKAFGGALFGLFSSDVRNSMHCKNCGYKW